MLIKLVEKDFPLRNLNFYNIMLAGVLYKNYLIYNEYNFLSMTAIFVFVNMGFGWKRENLFLLIILMSYI